MPPDRVVLVHGLWMNGLVFGVLRQRLQRDHGFDVHTFTYPTLHGDLDRVSSKLADFAGRVGSGRPVHLVGHSLGGAVVYRALRDSAAAFGGNAVLLGSPLKGSRAARSALQWPMLRPLLGPHVSNELASECDRCWEGQGALGAIAGTLPVGTGQYFAHFDEDNDGTVGVSETVIPGLKDHLVLPHSHMGMLFADDVARQVAHFLRNSAFRRPGPG
jgi:pimeloyl-ACP methyl ester carboxylesterase